MILGLAALLNLTEALFTPEYCPYPYTFYADGSEPLIPCCKACSCFCPKSKEYFWTQGGKCWAKCNCQKECKPIVKPPPTCPYPYKFYADGEEPSVVCCKACHCKCAKSKVLDPPTPGGKCWAKCDCLNNCDAISDNILTWWQK